MHLRKGAKYLLVLIPLRQKHPQAVLNGIVDLLKALKVICEW